MAKASKPETNYGAKQTPPVGAKASGAFDEWMGQVKVYKDESGGISRSFEKLKVVRKGVKITDDEAETLNRGVLHGPDNKIVNMYLPVE